MNYLRAIWFLIAVASAQVAAANLESAVDACLLRGVKQADPETTVATLRERCRDEALAALNTPVSVSLVMQRLERERMAERIRSVLIPHQRNYVLPASYMFKPNNAPFTSEFGEIPRDEALDNVEAKFQVSLKVPLIDGFLTGRDLLYLGVTTRSYWQAYNSSISAPFRETNYEPELFWAAPLPRWMLLKLDAGVVTLGLSHQSNGRGGSLSRSWNRLYANFVWEKNRFVFNLKPWWRIPERDKRDPLDARGDDNPEITDFLGHFEFSTVYRRGNHEVSALVRNNFKTHKGAFQLEWTFPLWRGVRGYAQYFDGYGESLIDYNARVRRIGVGFLLTDLL